MHLKWVEGPLNLPLNLLSPMTSALSYPLGTGGQCSLLCLLQVVQGRIGENTEAGVQSQEAFLDARVPPTISKSWSWEQVTLTCCLHYFCPPAHCAEC
jgi:hypothetical protein